MNETESAGYLYIVFSATPFKIGRFIRLMLRTRYNHMSISLSPTASPSYSFARYYLDIPFYGGFVTETQDRFCYHGKSSDIKICALPVTKQQLAQVQKALDGCQAHPERYAYNLFSAALTPLHRRVLIDNAYTCVEFAVSILSLVRSDLSADRFYSLAEMEALLQPYIVQEGELTDAGENADGPSSFFLTHNVRTGCRLTLQQLQQLARRYLSGQLLLPPASDQTPTQSGDTRPWTDGSHPAK